MNNSNHEKKPLTFVSEGIADVKTQKEREQAEQEKFEAERQRRNRKSLREQLRANAINKQREFKSLVKEREGFNRLSKEELDFFQKTKEKEDAKEEELSKFLEEKGSEFERKKKRFQRASDTTKSSITSEKAGPSMPSKKGHLGIVKKRKKSKVSVTMKKLNDTT
ncbi:hypothetical protein KAFR_0F00650 [Kazachstania africana CBS 2517]|uniref:FAM192A/Fyv6 N-terminal domain-containing protein n=1 Tax=Kazachstania africana (strain ATCC 22294 / BCRC 22015 / CBS 2517 / CECT 1963 / NBRC 1671 / NRRL Y-8276) TaxID=1071382 RepID=H2AWB2_KAZAF|nr:hypothetical protein KAFR_0F00650 [Kazachstania africana CBS 2517]CCF58662.1 hypothetical protein KAFR_0F00650 [Kazachstania africana CBS 2517]